MTQPALRSQKKKGYYTSSFWILLALSTAFFVRVFCAATRLPSVLVHIHFLTVPFALVVAIATSRVKSQKQLEIVQVLLSGLTVLFGTMVASALLNDAGVINAVFSFLMLGEPFMLLAAIACLPVAQQRTERLKKWLVIASFANLFLALIQYPLLDRGLIRAGTLTAPGDAMGGVFFPSGAGNYVSATVSAYFGLYYFISFKAVPLWLRTTVLLLCLFQVQLSDSKQVLFALLVGWILMALTNVKKPQKALLYIISFVLAISIFYWCTQNLEEFAAFKNYMDKEGVYGPDGEAIRIKFLAFRVIPTYYHSPLNWLFGLGPGHTVGRLGGWLLKENWSIFGPLGATRHPVSDLIMQENYKSWIANESTMFSAPFGWAGIWGDLGLAGLAAYLLLGYIVWCYFCFDNFSKFLLLTVMVFGLIFTQMEEPGYMLYTAALIGIRWYENKIKTNTNSL